MAKWFSFAAFLIAACAAYLLFESQGAVETMQKKGEAQSKELGTAKDNLGKAKIELTDAQTKLSAKTAEAEKANADLATATTKLTEATGNLEAIQKQIADAFGGNAADIKTGISNLKENITKLTEDKKKADDSIAAANKEKDEAVAAKAEAEKKVAELNAVNASLTAANGDLSKTAGDQKKQLKRYTDSFMEKGVRGRVLAVNSGWGFAVISIGDKQGAAANKTLVVARGGQGIGKLRISNVEANQSIADIVPNSFIRGSYVQPGDDVIFMGDEKVEAEPAAAGAVTAPPLPR